MGLHRRVSALEEYIDRRVEERLEVELDSAFDRLQKELPRDEALRVLAILAAEERDKWEA